MVRILPVLDQVDLRAEEAVLYPPAEHRDLDRIGDLALHHLAHAVAVGKDPQLHAIDAERSGPERAPEADRAALVVARHRHPLRLRFPGPVAEHVAEHHDVGHAGDPGVVGPGGLVRRGHVRPAAGAPDQRERGEELSGRCVEFHGHPVPPEKTPAASSTAPGSAAIARMRFQPGNRRGGASSARDPAPAFGRVIVHAATIYQELAHQAQLARDPVVAVQLRVRRPHLLHQRHLRAEPRHRERPVVGIEPHQARHVAPRSAAQNVRRPVAPVGGPAQRPPPRPP